MGSEESRLCQTDGWTLCTYQKRYEQLFQVRKVGKQINRYPRYPIDRTIDRKIEKSTDDQAIGRLNVYNISCEGK